jgi:prevent-host-death family protein
MSRESRLAKGSYRSYLENMKTVGVKMLKNNLSKYLKLVRQGETVLVTDRNEVVAEIRRPQKQGAEERFRAFLEEEARLGRVRLATSHDSKAFERLAALPRPKVPVDIQALMDEIREDR